MGRILWCADGWASTRPAVSTDVLASAAISDRALDEPCGSPLEHELPNDNHPCWAHRGLRCPPRERCKPARARGRVTVSGNRKTPERSTSNNDRAGSHFRVAIPSKRFPVGRLPSWATLPVQSMLLPAMACAWHFDKPPSLPRRCQPTTSGCTRGRTAALRGCRY